MRLQQIILPIEDYRARAGDSYNVSMLKHALSVIGREFGPPRPPQRRLTADERAEVEALLKPILAAEEELQCELASVGLSKR
jgi:4-hydroxy-tetrahydrodipicolinate synthase